MTTEPEMFLWPLPSCNTYFQTPQYYGGENLSLEWEGSVIILVLKRVSVLHHGVHQMMQYTDCTKAFFIFKMPYSFKVDI